MRRRLLITASALAPWLAACQTARKLIAPPLSNYREPHRPQFHFTPSAGWMDKPCGLVFHQGVYHLFYQYHPAATLWGAIHWGHATSRDLVRWGPQPIALEPEEERFAFSGSTVVDTDNTAGFGAQALVALYTRHDMAAEIDDRRDFQTQHLAYSVDGGRSWLAFDDEPVMPNPGAAKDFRDPKLLRHAPSRRWVAVVAAGDHVEFWVSRDLKRWEWKSDFGRRFGSHASAWESPDLFALPVENGGGGEQRWVLLQSMTAGSPNSGSGMQYFIGEFDGEQFVLDERFEREVPYGRGVWLDQGRDHFGGLTWPFGSEGQRALIAWMSNWDYARQVPASSWRGAMTLPVTLSLRQTPLGLRLHTRPLPALETLRQQSASLAAAPIRGASIDLVTASGGIDPRAMELELVLEPGTMGRCGVELSNSRGERYRIGFDATQQLYYSDRTEAGDHRFSARFAGTVHTALRPPGGGPLRLRLFFDASSAELFADDGALQMTEVFFPSEDFTHATLFAEGPGAKLISGRVHRLARIWP
ncbi:glycoside hydrolase family 32 protein [Ideonella sp. DXS29W]|uniref:Glycoside hydrolase family 32 protein n=1 Tax=Ideonella lacteola TaxID=2984193 RepID=A0ABU9BX31_9BURK